MFFTSTFNYAEFFETLYMSKYFNPYFFCANLKSCLGKSPREFREEFLTTISIFSESITLHKDDWLDVSELISSLDEADLENFCVIARLFNSKVPIFCDSIFNRPEIFQNLLISSRFRFSDFMMPNYCSPTLFKNKSYGLFLLAFVIYIIEEENYPFVYDPSFIVFFTVKLFNCNIEKAPPTLVARFVLNFEKLPIMLPNQHDFEKLEL